VPTGPILLIDDDETLLRLYGQAIETRGYPVITATRGREGLRLMREAQPACVLLDGTLPDIPGAQVCERARASMKVPVPVIFLSAHESVRVLYDALIAGVDDFVVKDQGFAAVMARITFWRQSPFPGLPAWARQRTLAVLERILAGWRDDLRRFPDRLDIDPGWVDGASGVIERALAVATTDWNESPGRRLAFLGYVAGVVCELAADTLAGRLRLIDVYSRVLMRSGIIELKRARETLRSIAPACGDERFQGGLLAGLGDARRAAEERAPLGGLAELATPFGAAT